MHSETENRILLLLESERVERSNLIGEIRKLGDNLVLSNHQYNERLTELREEMKSEFADIHDHQRGLSLRVRELEHGQGTIEGSIVATVREETGRFEVNTLRSTVKYTLAAVGAAVAILFTWFLGRYFK